MSPGDYVYSLPANGACPALSSTVVVTETDSPDAGSPGNVSLCAGSGIINLYDKISGTPDGGGSWSGPSVLNNGYLGSFTPGISIAGEYTYTIAQAGCAPVTTTVTVDELEILVGSLAAGDCDNMGTDEDASDDIYSATITAVILNGSNNTGTYTVTDAFTIVVGNGSYGSDITLNNLPANGLSQNYFITDDNDLGCSLMVTIQAPESCSVVCTIQIDSVWQSDCWDYTTPSIPSDDEFFVSFIGGWGGANIGSGFTWEASWIENFNTETINGIGTIPYNNSAIPTEIYGLPSTNIPITITITDVDNPTCFTEIEVISDSCSPDCEITINPIPYSCSPNNTLTDPTDDIYNLGYAVYASNLDFNGQFVLSINGSVVGTYDYQGWLTNEFIGGLPANGQDVTMEIVDITNTTCPGTITYTAPEACSNDCIMNVQVEVDDCDTGLDPFDSVDDTWTFTVMINGQNFGNSTGWTGNDSAGTSGNYDEVVSFGPFPMTASDQTITINDNGGNCDTILNVAAPAACVIPCSITAFTADPSTCFIADNNYSVSGSITFENAPDTGTLTVTVDGLSQTFNAPFTSPQAYTINGLTSDGSVHSVTASFSADAGCNDSVNITAPADCTPTPCSMDMTATVGPCDPADNQYSVSGSITFANAPATGTLTVTVDGLSQTFNAPFTSPQAYTINGLTSDGTIHSVTASFSAEVGCTDSVDITAPQNCECVITNAMITAGSCINEPNTIDDSFDLTIQAEALNAIGQYEVSINGDLFGTYDYDVVNTIINLPADGSNLTVLITDLNDINCTYTADVTSPVSCTCSLILNAQFVSDCDPNGSVSIPADDTFSVTLNVSDINGSATYIVNDGNTDLGIYMYNTDEVIADLPADGSLITLTITDANDATCFEEIQVSQPSCSPCPASPFITASTTVLCAGGEVILTAQFGVNNGTGTFTITGDNGIGEVNAGAPVVLPATIGCGPVAYVFTALAICDATGDPVPADDSGDLEANITVYVYPDNLMDYLVLMGENTCETSVGINSDCEDYFNISPSLSQLALAGDGSGIHSYVVSYNSATGIGLVECIDPVTVEINYDCPLPCTDISADLIDGALDFCNNGDMINLSELLASGTTAGGVWSLDGLTAVNGLIDLTNVSAGDYTFTYTINPPDSDPIDCLPEMDSIDIRVESQPTLSMSSLSQVCNTTAEGSILNLYSLIQQNSASGIWTDVNNSGAVISGNNYDFNGVAPGQYVFTYTISAIDPCEDVSESVTVTVEDCRQPSLWIPTAFSPNGDGQNDEFRAIGVKVTEVEIKIYDRWGALYYEGDGYTAGWDGTYNGEECEVEVYVYWARAIFDDGSEELYKGNVTLIR